MDPITAAQIRAAFVNTSRREATQATLPDHLDELPWESLDLLGWVDRKFPQRAYAVAPVDGELVGIMLRASDAPRGTKALCAWCQDLHLANPVSLYVARRAGSAGRNGDTVGTLVCTGFECSANVRKKIPSPYEGFDMAAADAARVAGLRERSAAFLRTVRG